MKYLPLVGSALLSSAALLLASLLGTAAVALVACGVCVLIAWGWPQLMGVTARTSLSIVILIAGVVAVLGASLVERASALFFWSTVALAFGVMVVFVIQVLRGTGRPQRLESTLGASTGVVISTTAAGWVAGYRYPLELTGVDDDADDTRVITVRGLLPTEGDGVLGVSGQGETLSIIGLGALLLLVVVLIASLPARDRVVFPLVIVGGVVAGVAAGFVWGQATILFCAILGAGAGVLVGAFRRFLILQGAPAGVRARTAVGAAPVAALGAVIYFAERLLIG
ncbi:MAG: hypothetical protein Q4F53_03530 [Nesterenkonia sp.]|nr:hypothetical protein [Nesterenkonia sp.]